MQPGNEMWYYMWTLHFVQLEALQPAAILRLIPHEDGSIAQELRPAMSPCRKLNVGICCEYQTKDTKVTNRRNKKAHILHKQTPWNHWTMNSQQSLCASEAVESPWLLLTVSSTAAEGWDGTEERSLDLWPKRHHAQGLQNIYTLGVKVCWCAQPPRSHEP